MMIDLHLLLLSAITVISLLIGYLLGPYIWK
jgi:hypothetical protein